MGVGLKETLLKENSDLIVGPNGPAPQHLPASPWDLCLPQSRQWNKIFKTPAHSVRAHIPVLNVESSLSIQAESHISKVLAEMLYQSESSCQGDLAVKTRPLFSRQKPVSGRTGVKAREVGILRESQRLWEMGGSSIIIKPNLVVLLIGELSFPVPCWTHLQYLDLNLDIVSCFQQASPDSPT